MTANVNYYSELAKLNVNEYVEKKGKFSYLSWTYAVDQLRKRHPDATWDVKRFGADQLPYLKTDLGYFVEVPVTVNGVTLSQVHPVLDNNNRPIEKPNSFQINTSIQRGLVKSIALHGLGLYIYAGEDLPEIDGEESPALVVTPSAPDARAIAREKATKAAQERKANATPPPVVDDLPFETPQEEIVASATDEAVEPANEGQIKVINNMLKMISNKKKDTFNQEEFLNGILTGLGKAGIEELSFDEAKDLVAEINTEMRKK